MHDHSSERAGKILAGQVKFPGHLLERQVSQKISVQPCIVYQTAFHALECDLFLKVVLLKAIANNLLNKK